MKNIYLIMGRSGSGKTTIGNILKNKYGMKGVCSYTTRPPRCEHEKGHYFISAEEFSKVKENMGLAAYTKINGYEYGTTPAIVDKSDFYIIDPAGIQYFRENYHGKKGIRVIYIFVSESICMQRMSKRGDSENDINKRIIFDNKTFRDASINADITIANVEITECVKKIKDFITTCEESRSRILFDLDNVLDNLTELWIKSLNVRHGLQVDIKEYDMRKAFPSLTEKEIYEPLDSGELFYLMTPIENSQEYLKKLIDEKHGVYILTASHYKALQAKISWIKYFFPFVKWDHVIISGKKQLINGDILVDDCPDNLIGGKYRGILLNYPWNSGFPNQKYNIERAYDFKDVYDKIEKIIRGRI